MAFPETRDTTNFYGRWDDVPGQDHEETVKTTDHDDEIEDFNLDKKADERLEDITERALNNIQGNIEKEYHEKGDVFVYGIHQGEIFPAVIITDDEAYANSEWVESKAGEMLDLRDVADLSPHKEEITGTLQEMKMGIPDENLDRAYLLMGGFEHLVSEGETKTEEGSYLFPVLSEKDYEELAPIDYQTI